MNYQACEYVPLNQQMEYREDDTSNLDKQELKGPVQYFQENLNTGEFYRITLKQLESKLK